MSLYTKYRPSSFDEVKGQDVIVKILTNAIMNDKVNHSYLFTGQRGTGKTSVARILAKTLNCINKQKHSPCNKCDQCSSFNKRINSDIIEIDAASNNGVDDIREIKEKINYQPTLGEWKIYVIDEVHMLSKSAFNALLKTLEETPKNVIFILATTEFNKIPETIISRCQVLNFKLLTNNEISNQLKYISDEENIEITKEAIDQITLLGKGSMRDSISNLEKVISYSNKIDTNIIAEVYNVSSKNEIINILNAFNKNDVNQIMNIINEMKLKGIDFEITSSIMINYILDYIFYLKTNNSNNLSHLSFNDVNKIKIDPTKAIKLAKKITNLFLERMDSNYFKILFEIILLEDLTSQFNYSQQLNHKPNNNEEQPLPIEQEKPLEISKLKEIVEEKVEDEMEHIKEIVEEKVEVIEHKATKESIEKINETIETEIDSDEMSQLIVTAEFEIEKNEIENKKFGDPQFDISCILNILSQKDINVTRDVKNKWHKIQDKFNNKKFGRFVPLLISGDVMFASDNAIAIYYKHIIESNKVLEHRFKKKFNEFIEEILGSKFLIFPINKIQFKEFKNKYELIKKGIELLPKSTPIILPELEDDIDKTQEMKMIELKEVEELFE